MNNFAIQKVRTGIGPSSPSHRLCIPLCVSHVVGDESAATGRIKKTTWEYRVAQPVPPKDPALAPKKDEGAAADYSLNRPWPWAVGGVLGIRWMPANGTDVWTAE